MPKQKPNKRVVSQNNSGPNRQNGQILPKGLHNLGNTCYFNSTLQCLCRVSGLKDWVEKLMRDENTGILKRSTDEGNTVSLKLHLLRHQSPLSTAYCAFVSELLGSHSMRLSVSPMPLLSELIKLYPRFSDFGQHDSHEVLRYLLDGLRLEELKVWQRAILSKLKFSQQSPEEVKAEVRTWGKSTNFCTTVDRIFGGVLLTSLICSRCNHISIHFEVFLDLSLPILTEEGGSSHSPYRKHIADFRPKTKREIKKERKRKDKRNGKTRDPGCFENDAEDDDFIYNERKTKKKGGKSKKGKYSQRSLKEEDISDKSDMSERTGDDEGEEIADEEVDSNDEQLLTPQSTLGNEQCDVEDPKSIEKGLSDDIHGVSSTHKDISEVDSKFVSQVDGANLPISCQQCNGVLCKNGCEKIDLFDSSESFASALNGDDENDNMDDSRNGSVSTGENADLEDNVDEVEDPFSDSSMVAPLASVDLEASLSKDLATKLRIAEAGDETAIAQPEEEAEAKAISVCPILPTLMSGLTDLERCLAKFVESTTLTGDSQALCERCTERAKGGVGHSEGDDSGDVRCDSVKRDLILKLPPVLTLHLKRYQQFGYRLQKCSKRVTFPINLDLRPYCSRLAQLSSGEGQYRLFGVVEHSGQLRRGHYVCYVAEEKEIPSEKFIASLEKPDPWPLRLHHLVCQLRRADSRIIKGLSDANCVDDDSKSLDTRSWFHFSDTHVNRVPVSTVLSAEPYLLFYQRVR